MQLRYGTLRRFTAQRWLADVFASAFSNLRMVSVLVPLWLSPTACRVGGRTQAESRIARSKRFGRSDLQSLNNSISEKPRLGLQNSRAADLCALIDVRGLLPSRQIDIPGLQQTVILLKRYHCALNFWAVNAVGFNRAAACGPIAICRQGSLDVANAVACFPKSGYVVVKHRQRLDTVSKRSLHRKPTADQVLDVVFVLLEILGIHFEMGMNPHASW